MTRVTAQPKRKAAKRARPARSRRKAKASVLDRRGEFGINAKRSARAWRETKAFAERCRKRFKTVQGKPLKLEEWELLIVWCLFAGIEEILVLVPKGNGKTTLAAAIGTDHLERTEQAEVYVGASTRDQADKLYSECWRLSYALGLEPLPGYKRINRRDPNAPDDVPSRRVPVLGSLKVLASDKLGKGTLEGIAPTLGLIDEYQAHVSTGIYDANQGALHKRGGQLLTISTAGHDEDGPLGVLRRNALALPFVKTVGALTIATDGKGKFAMLEWACAPTAKLTDIKVVAEANPASYVTQTKLRRLHDSPSMTEGRWARYHANVWTEGEEIWLPSGEWNRHGDAALRDPPPGTPVIDGLDFARSYDCAALVRLWWDEERERIAVKARIWRPDASQGEFIPYKVVEDAIREEHERYDLLTCGFDQHLFKRSAEVLEEEGISMRVVPMNPTVWVPLTADLMTGIKTGEFVHDGDPELAKHVNAGELLETPSGQRLHGRTKRRVDALMALGIAYECWGRVDGADPWSDRLAAGEALL